MLSTAGKYFPNTGVAMPTEKKDSAEPDDCGNKVNPTYDKFDECAHKSVEFVI
jgi:hypothetical protein